MKKRSGRTAVAAVAVPIAAVALAIGLAPPSSAGVPATVSGSAFGMSATGPQPLEAVPDVQLPPSGAAQTGQSLPLDVPGLVKSGNISVSADTAYQGGARSTVSTDAAIDNLRLEGEATGLTVSSIGSNCFDGPKGPLGQDQILSPRIAGVPLGIPLAPNTVLPQSNLGPLAGKISVEVNVETINNRPSSVSETAMVITVFSTGEVIRVANSECGR